MNNSELIRAVIKAMQAELGTDYGPRRNGWGSRQAAIECLAICLNVQPSSIDAYIHDRGMNRATVLWLRIVLDYLT